MGETPRAAYRARLARIYNHLDYYLQKTFENGSEARMEMSAIEAELQGTCGVKIRKKTILRYNTHQFSRYQVAPLEWAGEDSFALNAAYYSLLAEKVFAPKVGCPGRPRKRHRDPE